jgi:protein-S-isoprenylcysteine O-methyltransferase Ste14
VNIIHGKALVTVFILEEVRQMKAEVKRGIIKGTIRVTMFYLLLGIIMFTVSGRLDWWQAWAWLGIVVVEYIVMLAILDPELIAERSGIKQDAKRWDIPLAMLMSGLGTIIEMLIASLDKRFAWTQPLPLYAETAGIVLFVTGCVVVTWSMYSNKFFGPLVRIQKDRGHTVCNSGPYRIIRHPGYLGAILTFIGTPLMLGTLWAFIPAGLIIVDVIVRTALEDKTLKEELEGYKDFAARVKYRLLPGVW